MTPQKNVVASLVATLALFHCLISVTKVPDMRTCQNEHTMLPNLLQCLSILLLRTSKTDNNALDIDAIYNFKLRKT
jgi:hypothetical protein